MKKIVLLTLMIFNFSFSQKIIKDISLSKLIDETSGLEIIGNQFITHNDSGGEPKLYYLNKKGKIVSERKITGVKNNDWEDITQDDEFIYVADMGNNYDTRKNLSVIKIPKDKNLVIDPEIIKFNYPEQIDFRYKKLSQFDAEALISINEFLYI